jgi:hypothetical protein
MNEPRGMGVYIGMGDRWPLALGETLGATAPTWPPLAPRGNPWVPGPLALASPPQWA